VATFAVEAGGGLFRLEFATLDFLTSLEALDGADIHRLPDAVRQATIAVVLQSFQDVLEDALNTTLMPLSPSPAPAFSAWLDPPLHFTLDFTDQNGRKWPISLRLRVATEEGARWLENRILTALPNSGCHPERNSFPITTTLLAGKMRLPLGLLAGLAVSDILLPPEYPAGNGQLFLVINEHFIFRLQLSNQEATVLDRVDHFFGGDISVSSENTTSTETPASLDTLEVEIHFELDKKLLPLAEVESLAPGKTFPLGIDPLSAVTVTLNGRALATGRLVDLNGTLGVQITRLIRQPRND
jgi:type III secretion system YscQ/HrcQ family protein